MGLTYIDQPVTNGTGGALLAARDFLSGTREQRVIITMGDVPLVKKATYGRLLEALEGKAMVVLGFSPRDHGRYGALEANGDRVLKITEWEYWKEYPPEQQAALTVFNSGIYAADLPLLFGYLDKLEANPHKVKKKREGHMVLVEEFFITDLVEFMNNDGLAVSYVIAAEEEEVMGVDNPEALRKVQWTYSMRNKV
jgi:bifunctional UDP-N-acetylglucosamine pyrophosphorylase/glucosamine-1-phosphate N-acetyltransferase